MKAMHEYENAGDYCRAYLDRALDSQVGQLYVDDFAWQARVSEEGLRRYREWEEQNPPRDTYYKGVRMVPDSSMPECELAP